MNEQLMNNQYHVINKIYISSLSVSHVLEFSLFEYDFPLGNILKL